MSRIVKLLAMQRHIARLVRTLGLVMEKHSFPFFELKSLIFNDGTHLDITNDDVLIVVGSNNSGKSATLREIEQGIIYGKKLHKIIVKDLQFIAPQNSQQISKWINDNTVYDEDGTPALPYLGRRSARWDKTEWDFKDEVGLGIIGKILTLRLSTEERIKAANPVDAINIAKDAETHPVHRMFSDEKFEADVDSLFYQVFGTNLVVNRAAGKKISLHVGQRPVVPEGKDRVSREYILAVHALPTLETQGDGIRSFVGVLISILASERRVILIDEPEAFLHPPQAFSLSKIMIEQLPKGRQLLV